MIGLNRATLIGRVCRQPEPTGSGEAVRFRLHHAAGDEIDVIAADKLGSIIAHYVKAGPRLYVEGTLRQRNGTVRLEADQVILLGHRHGPPEHAEAA